LSRSAVSLAVIWSLRNRMKMRAPANLAKPAGAERASLAEPHRLAVRVYYEDTDFSGNVYHASYLRFLERGRTEFLRSLGIEHSRLFEDSRAGSWHFVVRAMGIAFLKPARMDDTLLVETIVNGLGGASVEMGQEIRRDGEILLTAQVRIAIVAGGKARRLPAEVFAKLKATGPARHLEEFL
jgi:acyl-CoA thioester hydrolase